MVVEARISILTHKVYLELFIIQIRTFTTKNIVGAILMVIFVDEGTPR